MCFSDTRTDVPNSTDLDNTRKRKADHTVGGTDEHGRSHRCSVAAASSTSWFVEQPETDTTDRSTWLPTFTKQPGYIGQKRMANAEPYEFLELFLDESFWELLTVETNRYMACNKALSTAQEKQLQVLDYVTVPEIKTFFALYFAMGIVSQCNLRDYWQTKNVITQTPAFHDVMSRNRWCAIWTHLHFSDNTKAVPRGEPGFDRLFKIRQLINTVVSKFCTHYQAAKELSLDEMVIAFKGKSTLKQYNPRKPDKWGFKAFVLCEAKTGYALQWLLYSGRESDSDERAPPCSVSYNIVQKLVAPHYGQGHIIYMDSYYTSPDVADVLQENKCGLCGPCNVSRSGMPHDLRSTRQSMTKGDPPVIRRNDHKLACA